MDRVTLASPFLHIPSGEGQEPQCQEQALQKNLSRWPLTSITRGRSCLPSAKLCFFQDEASVTSCRESPACPAAPCPAGPTTSKHSSEHKRPPHLHEHPHVPAACRASLALGPVWTSGQLLEPAATASPAAPPCLGPSSQNNRPPHPAHNGHDETDPHNHPATAAPGASERREQRGIQGEPAVSVPSAGSLAAHLPRWLWEPRDVIVRVVCEEDRRIGCERWEGGGTGCLRWIALHKREATRTFQFHTRKPW